MNALLYLTKRTVINWIKSIRRNPQAMILTVAVVFLLVMTTISAMLPSGAETSPESLQDIRILYIIAFGAGLLFLGVAVYGGTGKGAAFFSLSDVNLLFTAPLSSNRILLYGVCKQMGRTLLVSLYILFQSFNLRASFGLGAGGMTVIFLAYFLLIFFSQLLTAAIYSFTNGREKRKKMIRGAFLLLLFLLILFLALQVWLPNQELFVSGMTAEIGKNVVESIYSFFTLLPVQVFPVAGWICGMVEGFLSGQVLFGMLWILCLLAGAALIVIGITRWRADYYEDCLVNSENAYRMKQAMKGDKSAVAGMTPVKRRNKETASLPMKGGSGASAFFYRHLLEFRRRSAGVVISLSTFLYLAMGILAGLLADGPMGPFVLLAIVSYIQLFVLMQGKWAQELARPFLYLVPDTPFRKLIFASLSTLLKPAVDGLLMFLAASLLSGTPVWQGLCFYLAYVSVHALLVAANILTERLFGKFSKSSIVFFFYILVALLMLVPGSAAAVGTGVAIGGTGALAFACLVLTFCNVLLAGLVALFCKDLVHDIELR